MGLYSTCLVPVLQNLDTLEPELQNLLTWKGAKSLGGKAAGYAGKAKSLGLFQNLEQQQGLPDFDFGTAYMGGSSTFDETTGLRLQPDGSYAYDEPVRSFRSQPELQNLMTREWYANAKSLGYFDKQEPELQNLSRFDIIKAGAKTGSIVGKIANQESSRTHAGDKKRVCMEVECFMASLTKNDLNQLSLLI